MKLFKRIALLIAVVASVACMGILAAACGDKNGEATEYVITVYYSDGQTVVEPNKYTVDICDASDLFCYSDFNLHWTDNNGQYKFNIAEVDKQAANAHVTKYEYVIHVRLNGIDELELSSDSDNIVNHDKPNAKVILKNVDAPQG